MTKWVALLKELGDRHEQLRVLGDMGQVKIDRGDFHSAEMHFTRLLEVCRGEDDLSERAFAARGLATIASAQGDHEAAVNHYAKAIAGYSACQKQHNNLEQAELHAGCGDSLIVLGRFREAMDRFGHALKLLGAEPKRKHEQTCLARVLHGLAACYQAFDQPSNAEECLQRAQSLSDVQEQAPQTMLWHKHPNPSP
ncbi:MAG: tetratricopeptide repeat protein [Sphaerospermopsis sp. SIO1G2]|nr:tetratricopeptide repeat protein [Sphaerospermopsis sp. SIO1G2]